ncbi:minichromosome maintenance protein MCM [Natronomonas sp. LN261]|uniref:minichromosome maintenance protein MCM n=1 Tax=Natronomonas sp. LN261 TaxID=2750669 RepID=UPI0015EF8DF4|nr:minichromosome maintenance protein MCM [Natronomonas sp. LN261]
MATTTSHDPTESSHAELSKDEFDELIAFVRDYYREELGTFVQQYPKDTTHFPIAFEDLQRGVSITTPGPGSFAETYLEHPDAYDDHLVDALDHVDLPVEVDLSHATVQVIDLPEWHTYYPGDFSPKDEAGHYRAVTGEIARATDVYARLEVAAFECQRCGTLSKIPQTDSSFQEPHECQGCERQGPFDVNLDESELVDAQMLRLQTPPEVAQGAGQEIDVYLEGEELVDSASVGDRVTVTGTVHLEQLSSGNQKTPKFEPYVDARHVALEESDHTEIDISPEERERIRALANGAEGEPLEVAGQSLKPEVYGHETVKQMLVLAMVGGAGPGDLRGDFHILCLGDPGTAKSELLDRVEEIAPRSVGVSGKGATEAGVTASAVQDDFGDGNAATLKAGALVKANGGVVCIDELDDMPTDVRAAMLGPMSKQRIHVNKWGINARLSTETAVIAAGNPKHGRFDQYEPIGDQFDLAANLLSRFDLIFTFHDQLDEDRDAKIADRILRARDAKKRSAAGDDLEGDEKTVEGPIDADLLRKWIALAKQQPDPVFANDEVRQALQERFTALRGMHDYASDQPVPVTFRKLPATVRIAEAAAKFEFSETIEPRHAKIATEAVGESMQDFGVDEDGNLDADIQETGASMTQKDKIRFIADTIAEIQQETESGHCLIETLVERATEEDLGPNQVDHYVGKLKDQGVVYEPATDALKYVGGA